VIGLGLMGSAFASNLLLRGYEVHVTTGHNKRPSLSSLKEPFSTRLLKDVASSVDIVMTSLTDQNAIDSVALGEDGSSIP